MRDILFKAKRLDNGKWMEGLVGHPHVTDTEKGVESYYFHAKDEMDFWSQCTVSAETICQYTGLTDKNGNKIWENDVVEGLLYLGIKTKAIIVFKDGAFGLKWYRGNVEEFSAFTSICNISYEVIGNIIDNPELLSN